MGLGPFEAEFLLAEHRHRPIRGTMLTISRQTVIMTPERSRALLAETGTPLRKGIATTLDTQTVGYKDKDGFISDDSFYALFSDAKLSILDVSDYEGADVLHDMNKPIGPELENRFDFILCGSCMDNIFDPATALRNLARLTKPGGRIFLFEWGCFPTAYMGYTPDWFVDFFAGNNFADCKAYTLYYPMADSRTKYTDHNSFDLYYYDPIVEHSGQFGYQCSHPRYLKYYINYIIAEKGPDSTWDHSPIQVHYRLDIPTRKPYLDAALRFRESPRPLFRRGDKPILGDPQLSTYGTLKPVASWEGNPLPPKS